MTNWILIRGLARQKEHWGPFIQILEDLSHGKVICLDLPGVGDFQSTRAPLTIPEYTDFLHQEFEKIKSQNPHQNWFLGAVSLGGMIGLDWVARYPHDFKGFVAMNTSASRINPIYHRLNPRVIQRMLPSILLNRKRNREQGILEVTTNMIEIKDSLVNQWMTIDERRPLTRETLLRQIYAASKFRIPSSVSTPILFVSGLKDRLANPKCSEALAKYFHASLKSHPHAGHDIALDAPKWLAQEMLQFSEKITSDSISLEMKK